MSSRRQVERSKLAQKSSNTQVMMIIGETGACTPWGHIRPPPAVDHRIHIMDQQIS